MLFYAGVIATILSALLITRRVKGAKNIGLFVVFVILWLIASLRDVSVGNDTISYVIFFESLSLTNTIPVESFNVENLLVTTGYENGFSLTTYLISLLTNNYTIYFMIIYGFIYFSAYKFIKNYSTDYLLSTIIYISLFFFGSMSLMRQSLAMAILMWGYKYIVERKFIPYLCIVLVATLIHQASIIMIVPYFMYQKEIGVKNVLLYTGIGAGLFLTINSIVTLSAEFNNRYGFYTDRLDSYSLGSIMAFIMYAGLSILLLMIYKKYIKTSKLVRNNLQYSFFVKMMLVGTVCSVIAIKVNALSRFILFFMFFAIISIPDILSLKKLPHSSSYRLIIIIVLLLYCSVILTYRPEWYSVTEYRIAL